MKKLAFSLSSVLIALLIGEALLHLFQPTVAYQYMPQLVLQSYYDESSLTDFTIKKNYKGRHVMTAAKFNSTVETNSLGWRDTEPDSREKVLFFGDSIVFGYGLNNEETIPDQLEKLAHRKIDFVNLGLTAGGSPDSYAVYLKKHQALQNKKVIVLLFTNDLNDMIENYCVNTKNQEVKIEDHSCIRIIKRNAFVKDGELFKSKSFMATHMPGWMRRFLKQSYLLALLRDRLTAGVESTAQAEQPLPSLEKFQDAMYLLHHLSRQLVVLTMAPKGSNQTPERFYEAVKKYCKDHHITHIHIPVFPIENYWLRDSHNNKEGSQKVAQFIYSKLPAKFLP